MQALPYCEFALQLVNFYLFHIFFGVKCNFLVKKYVRNVDFLFFQFMIAMKIYLFFLLLKLADVTPKCQPMVPPPMSQYPPGPMLCPKPYPGVS